MYMQLVKICSIILLFTGTAIANQNAPSLAPLPRAEEYTESTLTEIRNLRVARGMVIQRIKFNEKTIIRMWGKMTDPAALALIDIINDEEPYAVALAGPGGAMTAGILIHDYVKKYNIHTIILPDELCVSACALAAIGDQNIELHGLLLFHYPYYDTVSRRLTIDDIFDLIRKATWGIAQIMINDHINLDAIGEIINNSSSEIFVVADAAEFTRWKSDNFAVGHIKTMTLDELKKLAKSLQ